MVCGNRVFRCVIPLAAALTWAGSALADGPPGRDAAGDEQFVTTKRWYGWQTLAADAVPASLFLATIPVHEDQEYAFWVLGSVGFLSGGPIVHLANRQPLTALGSFGIRLVFPVIGIASGATDFNDEACGSQPDNSDAGDRCADGMVLGGLVGAAIASTIDATLLATERQRHRRDGMEAREATLVPSLQVRSGGARLSLRATF